MTVIILSNGRAVNLSDSENVRLQAALALRQFGEAVYFCDEERFCEDCAADRFIGMRAEFGD